MDAAKLNNELQKYIIQNNRWGIPALFVTESYNGVDAYGCTKFGRPMRWTIYVSLAVIIFLLQGKQQTFIYFQF